MGIKERAHCEEHQVKYASGRSLLHTWNWYYTTLTNEFFLKRERNTCPKNVYKHIYSSYIVVTETITQLSITERKDDL